MSTCVWRTAVELCVLSCVRQREGSTKRRGGAEEESETALSAKRSRLHSFSCSPPSLSKLISIPAIEALARFAAELAFDHLGLQCLRHLEALPARDDVPYSVETDVVCELDRSHRMASAELHREVDVARRGDAALDQRDGLDEVGDEEPVDDEAFGVNASDRLLAERARKAKGRLEERGVRLLRAHDLDKLHELHWIEEMEAEHLLWSTAKLGHLRNRERRRVRCDDAPVRDRRADLFVEWLLQRQIFDHGLDHQIAVCKITPIERWRHAAKRSVEMCLRLAFAHRPLLHGLRAQLLHARLDAFHPRVEEAVLGLYRHHLKTFLCSNLRNAMSHQAEANHTYA
mmetsp:Transcript_41573/g.91377  ORF Transcript_41573/g.91377 Transcript_41573/m.91377 type:complete len:343 (+) Transcript_41573:156-1184(+)